MASRNEVENRKLQIEGNESLQNQKGGEVTIPVFNIRTNDVEHAYGNVINPFWDMISLADNTPIILIKKRNTIIAGYYQLHLAKLKGQEEVPAVYIEDLQDISLEAIKKKFKDEKLYLSFAYNLYAGISGVKDLIAFPDFCKNIDYIFANTDISKRIQEQLDLLYYLIGDTKNGRS